MKLVYLDIAMPQPVPRAERCTAPVKQNIHVQTIAYSLLDVMIILFIFIWDKIY